MDIKSIEPGSIVVGVDGSDSADQAVVWAAEQASVEHRPLIVVSVAKPLSSSETGWMATGGVDSTEVFAGIRSQAQEDLERALNRARRTHPDLVVVGRFLVADPREALVELSADAHLVVVGSRGRGPIRSLLLGSVSAAVSRLAACPVVVLRPRHDNVVHQGVLVGTDCSARSQRTLEFAYEHASVRGLPLTVLFCCWDAGAGLGGIGIVPDNTPGLDDERALLARTVQPMADKFPDLQVRAEIARGPADECLVKAAGAVDIVVVGRHGRSAAAGFGLGSAANSVVEHASATVVVVPGA